MDFLGLPVDDTGDDERKTTGGMLLLKPVPAVQSSSVAVFEIPCQGMNLLALEQAAPVAPAQIRIG